MAAENRFTDDNCYAAQVAKRIGNINKEANITGTPEGGDKAIIQDAVERDISHVQSKSHQAHP